MREGWQDIFFFNHSTVQVKPSVAWSIEDAHGRKEAMQLKNEIENIQLSLHI